MSARNTTLVVLSGGLAALIVPWLLFRPQVGLPHWLSFFAFGLVAGSAWLVRTSSERRGVLMAALGVASSITILFWSTELLTDASFRNQWSHLGLQYLVPLATRSFAAPCAMLLAARRLVRPETPAQGAP